MRPTLGCRAWPRPLLRPPPPRPPPQPLPAAASAAASAVASVTPIAAPHAAPVAEAPTAAPPARPADAAYASDDRVDILNVRGILERGGISTGEVASLRKLIELREQELDMKEGKVPDVRRFRLGRLEWVRVPPNRGTGQVAVRRQQQKTNVVDYVMERMSFGTGEAARLMRRRRDVFTEAAARAEVICQNRLNVEQTLQAMHSVQASWTGMRSLKTKTLLRHFGINLNLASEASVKAHVQQFDVPIFIFYARLYMLLIAMPNFDSIPDAGGGWA